MDLRQDRQTVGLLPRLARSCVGSIGRFATPGHQGAVASSRRVNDMATSPVTTKSIEPQRVLPVGRVFETERRLAWVRLLMVATGLVFFPFVQHRPGYRPVLGWSLLVIGALYVIATVPFEAYTKYRSEAAKNARALGDATLTLAWIGATGGADSPWVVALPLALATSAYRYGTRGTAALSMMYAGGYVAIGAAMGQLSEHGIDLAIRATYVLVVGGATTHIVRGRAKRLASRLRLLSTMQEVARVGSWEWSLVTNALTWSDELRRIFGLPDGVEPTVEFFTQSIHPDDRERYLADVDEAVAAQRAFQLNHRIVLADGTVRWLHCRGVIVQGDDGRPVAVVGSTQDVTDQKMLEAKLLLSDRLASIGTMASGITHEINNPLAYIATNLEVIERDLSASGPKPDLTRVREALEAARHGFDRVREIVRGLKTFARPHDERFETVSVARAVDFAVRIVSVDLESRARLVREYVDVGQVNANEARLTQVFVNLLVNAAHAIERGTPDENEIRIRIGTVPEGRVVIEISDTGAGIPKGHLERIFDPFFTTKPTGLGTGLGLAICKGIIAELHGEISVESEVGAGSTFRVTLPLVGEAAQVDSRPEPIPASKTTSRRLRILVVDDEQRYAKSLELLLASDYDVTIATNGKRALELFAEKGRFDVILCDLMMPQMTGMDLHAALAERDPEQCSRMVFLTGGATNERARAFLARPDIRHLDKPLELPELEAAIADVSGTKREAQSVSR